MPKTYIQEVEERLDKKFPKAGKKPKEMPLKEWENIQKGYAMVLSFKHILRESIRQACERMVVEEVLIKHHPQCLSIGQNESYCDCTIKRYLEGRASARQDQLERLKLIG